MKNHNKAFGKVLREIRKSRGLTQETLAFESHLDRTFVSLLELGSRSPTLDTLMALSIALDEPLSSMAARIEDELKDHGLHSD